MIVERIIEALVIILETLAGVLESTEVVPDWPSWLDGTGSDTVAGSFEWFGDHLEPFAAWINLPFLVSVTGTLLAVRVGLSTWVLVLKLTSFLRGGGL